MYVRLSALARLQAALHQRKCTGSQQSNSISKGIGRNGPAPLVSSVPCEVAGTATRKGLHGLQMSRAVTLAFEWRAATLLTPA